MRYNFYDSSFYSGALVWFKVGIIKDALLLCLSSIYMYFIYLGIIKMHIKETEVFLFMIIVL